MSKRVLERGLCDTSSLEIRPSQIEGAGNGVFAVKRMKAGTPLGDYRGRLYHKYPKTNKRKFAYFLEIGRRPKWIKKETWRDKGHPIWVDGSNMLSVINGCRGDYDVQNCEMLSTGRFVLSKDVEENEEIVTDYGEDYWSDLEYETETESESESETEEEEGGEEEKEGGEKGLEGEEGVGLPPAVVEVLNRIHATLNPVAEEEAEEDKAPELPATEENGAPDRVPVGTVKEIVAREERPQKRKNSATETETEVGVEEGGAEERPKKRKKEQKQQLFDMDEEVEKPKTENGSSFFTSITADLDRLASL